MSPPLQVLAVICARGGSKILPRKNVAILGGRPLVAWTIEAATRAASVSRTIVSTDDNEIADVARRFGAEVPFMRPADLARDDTPGTDPVLHAVEWLERREGYVPDVVAYLQPTSPFRSADDVDRAIALLQQEQADTVVSVTEADHHPYWMKRIGADGWMHDFARVDPPIVRRQELPPVYALNGAMYIARRNVLVETRGWYTSRTAAYVMPFERSVDIDTPWDFRVAEMLLGDMVPHAG